MKVQTLSLANFRGFRQLELSLEPDVTVLVGVNGAGKTSVLDALSKALVQIPRGILGQAATTGLDADDVHASASTAVVRVQAAIAGRSVSWRLVHTRPGHVGTTLIELDELAPVIHKAKQAVTSGQPQLPLAIHLATNRSALDIPERIRKPHEFDALSAYENALDTGTSDFRGFFEWFREEEDVYNERKAREPLFESSGPTPAILHVRRAIEALFPNGSNLRVERKPQRMMLDIRGVSLDVSQLSDGEKCLLAMTGDIARRMVLADAVSDAPLEQEAIVLIDEIELHLHPALQRTVIPSLRRVFPHTQFVVSTHSPQVIASVQRRSVRLLEDFALKPLEAEVWRRDTNRILEGVFGDPGRPPEVAAKLNRLRSAVDADRVDDARALIDELRKLLEGDDDPDVVFYEQLLPPPVEGAAE